MATVGSHVVAIKEDKLCIGEITEILQLSSSHDTGQHQADCVLLSSMTYEHGTDQTYKLLKLKRSHWITVVGKVSNCHTFCWHDTDSTLRIFFAPLMSSTTVLSMDALMTARCPFSRKESA